MTFQRQHKEMFPPHTRNGLWNSLPQDIPVAKRLAEFKKGSDIYMGDEDNQSSSKY